MSVSIINADVLDGLRQIPDESVHCVVTSPPYWGLRDYGAPGQIGLEPTLAEHIAKIVDVFREVRRVLRKDGTLWLNYGDAYATSGGAGWQGKNGQRATRTFTAQNQLGNTAKAAALKAKDLMLIPERLAIALCDDGWYIRSRIIWCLSGGTRVYARTQKGDMPMTIKDLVRLDPATVKLWNGQKWTQVLGFSETPRPDTTFEIELRSGERIGCTAGHLWPTQRGNVRADELSIGDVIETCRLPEPEQVRAPSGLPDDDIGWFVGTFLADGSYGKDGAVIQIASNSNEVDRFTRLKKIADAYDGSFTVHYHEGRAASAHIYSPVLAGVLRSYISGENAHGKHLAVRCWKRTDAFLNALLLGYLQGDGSWDATAGRWRLGFTANDALAADLRTLCARLGFQCRLKRYDHESQWGTFPGWRGEIRLRPAARDGEIVAIRQSRARKFWDIGVEDEPHLFALASGVLTHNSKPNPMPESVTDRPTKSHEHIWLMSKAPRYFYDAEAIAEPVTPSSVDRLLQPTLGKQAGSTRAHAGGKTNGSMKAVGSIESRNARDVWTIATAPFSEAHFATFPPVLAERCIKAGCPAGGTVLDPFGGSGTTGLVADRLQRNAILIELNPEYAAMAERRLQNDRGALLDIMETAETPLLDGVAP